jgi:hypothetical protein
MESGARLFVDAGGVKSLVIPANRLSRKHWASHV